MYRARQVRVVVVVLPPPVALPPEQPHHPPRKNAARDLVRPGLLEVLVFRSDAPSAHDFDEPDGRVEQDVREHAGDQAVGDRVCERHDRQSQKRGDRVPDVPPVDVGGDLGHHGADEDERAARGPRRDRREDGREEDGDEEAEARDHGGDARRTALGYARAGLDKGRDRRHAEERADGDAEGVDEVGDCGPFEVLGALVDGAAVARHGVHDASGVEDVDVEKGNQCEAELAAHAGEIPFLHEEGLFDAVECDDFLEKVERVVAGGGVGEVGDVCGARPGDDGDEKDAGDDGALDAVHEEHAGQHAAAEDADPHGWVAHFGARGADAVHLCALDAPGQGDGGGGITGDGTDAGGVGQTDDG